MQQNILIVDDDAQLTSFLVRFFEKHGYRATSAGTAAQAIAEAGRTAFDLIVLDLILPDEDGLEVARQLRRSNEVPIIMLSARDEVYDRIVGLEIGADDYMTKPYEPRELLARVRTVLRRCAAKAEMKRPDGRAAPRYMRFGNVELDTVKSVASRLPGRDDIGLTSTEFALIKSLADAGGDVLTREQILEHVYGNSVAITDRAIDAHMVRLRRKLADGGGEEAPILTVHGVGYRLAAEIETG